MPYEPPPPDPGVPRHLATAPEDPRLRSSVVKAAAPLRRKGFNWLLIIPGVLPLLVPLYNRVHPEFWGLPFFYWYQMSLGVVGTGFVTFVYLVTKGRR